MSESKGFMKFKRLDPIRRPVHERIHDWKEIYQSPKESELQIQASRCMDCGVPFCQSSSGCPVENLIPEWNHLVQQGNWKKALKILQSTNNFPEFTGRLCPAPCESSCVLNINDSAVSIRLIENAIIEKGFTEGWVTADRALKKSGKKVAVIGSGPAGLASAQQLIRLGHEVTVFEKSDRPGGLLRYGIPDFKMEKEILDRRLDQLIAEGVEFQTNTHVGVNYETGLLHANFNAICLTLGAEQPRDLSIPGRELNGVHFAMDYLTQQNKRNQPNSVEQNNWISAHNKRVVIIGGGDTGADCIGTAHRQGCLRVQQFEILPEPSRTRHPSTPWPLWPLQLRTSPAHEEGCERVWNIKAIAFMGNPGHVQQVKAQVTTNQGSSECNVEADLVLLAIGFTGPSPAPLLSQLNIELNSSGTIMTDTHYMTTQPGVFAAGDARRGASLIVWAIQEGRRMAAAVDRFLNTPALNETQ